MITAKSIFNMKPCELINLLSTGTCFLNLCSVSAVERNSYCIAKPSNRSTDAKFLNSVIHAYMKHVLLCVFQTTEQSGKYAQHLYSCHSSHCDPFSKSSTYVTIHSVSCTSCCKIWDNDIISRNVTEV